MADSLPITLRGKRILEDELKRLLTVERPNVVKAIEQARDHGDISENAEYDAAKERQAFIEGRIIEIQAQIAGANVVDTSKLTGTNIVFGASVELMDLENDKKTTYQIVGVSEASVSEGRISILSPLARALIGKKQGDQILVQTPGGEKEYEVLKVYFV